MASNNVMQATLVARLGAIDGATEVTLWSKTVDMDANPNQLQQVQFPASLLSPGTWFVMLVMSVVQGPGIGNVEEIPALLPGTTTPLTLNIAAPTTGGSETPAPFPVVHWTAAIAAYAKSSGWIQYLYFGPLPAGISVIYQLKPQGVAWDDSSWIPAVGTGDPNNSYGPIVPHFYTGVKTLYAQCLQTGYTPSPVCHWNF